MSELIMHGVFRGREKVDRLDTVKPEKMDVLVFTDIHLHKTAWPGYERRFPRTRMELTTFPAFDLKIGKRYRLECMAEGECTIVTDEWREPIDVSSPKT